MFYSNKKKNEYANSHNNFTPFANAMIIFTIFCSEYANNDVDCWQCYCKNKIEPNVMHLVILTNKKESKPQYT